MRGFLLWIALILLATVLLIAAGRWLIDRDK